MWCNKVFPIFLTLLILSTAFLEAQDFVTISVADFETLSDQPADRLGLSVSESLSEALTMLSGVKLYERSQLERLTGELQMGIDSAQLFNQDTIQEVGQLVSIDYYVLGSVTRVADQLRITMRLVEIRTGNALLSTRLEGPYLDLFDLQDELAYRVIEALNINMTDLEKQRIEERRPENMESFEIYNLALSESDLQERRFMLEEARAKDPDYMMISQCLADTYLELGERASASFLYRQILQSHPDNYTVRYNQAVLFFDQNRVIEAREAFMKCLEMRPDDADVLFNLGLLYEIADDGTRLGPGSDLHKAADMYLRVLEISPNYPNALYALGIINIVWAQGESDPAQQKVFVDASIVYLERYLLVLPEAFNADEVEQNLEMFRGVQAQLIQILSP